MEQTLFQLVKASLFTDEDVEIPDWNAVFSEMKNQSIAALPGKWFKSHPSPEAEEWSEFCLMQQAQWVKVMYGQDQLLKLLNQHSIPCVIIKGAAAAMAYPNPTLRSMGDVDFLVKRCDFEKTASLLEKSGFCLSHEKDRMFHHYGYSKDGIHYELHQRLGSISYLDEQRISLFERGIDNKVFKESNGHSFPVLPSELNGLVLIFHINQHLRRGLGLRQIIDWMMYVHTRSVEEWENLVPLLRANGVERLARTVTVMCQRYLGLQEIIEDDGSYACDELMAYIMEKGNFGQKAGVNGRTASFALSVTNIKGLFQRLQLGGMSRWRAAKNHRALRPFAWLYQIFRILGELIRNKKSPKEVIAQSKQGVEQRKLIEALGLSIDRMIEQPGNDE